MNKPPVTKPDRTIIVLIVVLLIAGGLVAFMMLSIADRSEKSIQAIKEVKVSSGTLGETPEPLPDDSSEITTFILANKNRDNVNFAGQDFDRQSFAEIGKLTQAKELRFHECSYEPKWFEPLEGLKSITDIEIDNSPIDSEGLTHLSKLPRLNKLALVRIALKDNDLSALPPKIATLRLSHSQVSDKCIAHLAGKKSIENLDLAHTQVGDSGLPALGKIPNLSWLRLSSTPITNAGLKTLAQMKNLKNLYIEECPRLTDVGIKNLRKQLPNCHIGVNSEPKVVDQDLR